MANVADPSPARHVPAARVTPPMPLRLFAAPVIFLPVAAVPAPTSRDRCYAHDRGIPPVAADERLILIDWRSRLGAWRRETVCFRCWYEFLAGGDPSRSDEVTVWYPSAAPMFDGPRPLGQLAELPAEMPGRVGIAGVAV